MIANMDMIIKLKILNQVILIVKVKKKVIKIRKLLNNMIKKINKIHRIQSQTMTLIKILMILKQYKKK